MSTLLRQLWIDEHGFLVSAEMVVIATLVVLGLIAGMSGLQTALIGEYKDLGFAFRSLDQSYFFRGFHGCFSRCGRSSWTSGSAFYDAHLHGTVDADFAFTSAAAVDYGCTNCEPGVVVEEYAEAVPEAVPCPDCLPAGRPCDDCRPAEPPCTACPPDTALPVPPSPAAIPDPATGHYPPMTVPAY